MSVLSNFRNVYLNYLVNIYQVPFFSPIERDFLAEIFISVHKLAIETLTRLSFKERSVELKKTIDLTKLYYRSFQQEENRIYFRVRPNQLLGVTQNHRVDVASLSIGTMVSYLKLIHQTRDNNIPLLLDNTLFDANGKTDLTLLPQIPRALEDDVFFKNITCALTGKPIRNVVKDPTGKNIFYEKSAIEGWLANHNWSPATGSPLSVAELKRDKITQAIINFRLKQHSESLNRIFRNNIAVHMQQGNEEFFEFV